MKTYWDLSETERAALSSELVAKYADAELMRVGVLKPRAPKLSDETEPVVSPRVYYTLSAPCRYGDKTLDVVFDSRGAAETHLATAFDLDHDYEIGHAVARRTRPIVREVVALSEEDAAAHRSQLMAAKAAKEANEKERARFADEAKKVEQALRGMWDDWHECTARDREMRRVAETYQHYIEVAEGDRKVALKFLRKAFPDDEIKAAVEWCAVPELAVVSDAVTEEAVH